MPIYAQSSTLRNLTIPLVDIDQTTLADEQILRYNATSGKFENGSITSGGSTLISSGTNLGAGEEVFKQKTGDDLEFRTLTAGTGIALTESANEIQIEATAASTTASNIGSGQGFFKVKTGEDLQFRGLAIAAGSINLSVAQSGGDGNEVELTNTAEINTASNLGSGTGLFAQKSTYDLEFKSLVAGSNVTITNDADTVTIAASAQANTGFSFQFGLTFDGNGDVDTITNIPSGWTITNTGNIVTVTHNSGSYPKSITYWGKDSSNGWQFRFPTAGYQATMDTGQETTAFKIDVNATITGADASSEAKVNVIF